MDSSRLKHTKSGASAIEAGNEFQKGMVRRKKTILVGISSCDICLSFFVWFDLVRAEALVTYGEVGMSTMPFMIL